MIAYTDLILFWISQDKLQNKITLEFTPKRHKNPHTLTTDRLWVRKVRGPSQRNCITVEMPTKNSPKSSTEAWTPTGTPWVETAGIESSTSNKQIKPDKAEHEQEMI